MSRHSSRDIFRGVKLFQSPLRNKTIEMHLFKQWLHKI